MAGLADIELGPSTRTGRHKDYKGKGHRKGDLYGWDKKEFIAFDGEGTSDREEPLSVGGPGDGSDWWLWENPKEDQPRGIFQGYKPEPQPYVLLANSKGDRITAPPPGLTTVDCWEFILNSKVRYPNSIFVGFGFNYDINQMLRNIPDEHLWHLHDTNETRIGGYYLKWYPGKSLYIKHGRTKRSAIIYDCFAFFQKSFLATCQDYLERDDEELRIIEEGKGLRGAFRYDQLDDLIIPYNKLELSMTVRVMNRLREDFHAVGVDPSQWHGPGAVANKVYAMHDVPISRDIPEEVLSASQFAYAGGRFEQFRMGRCPGPIYECDIRSAYPAALATLPDLSDGVWEHVRGYEPGTFGVYRIEYNDRSIWRDRRPQPLFCRSKNGYISYPPKVQGWYWSPEAALVPDSVQEGYVFRGTDARPFAFVEAMYEQRRILKAEGNVTQRPLKLILNSLYGKLAQTVGATKKAPRWHQLEYAGYVTSHCRAQIYNAIQQNPDAIIAVETDGIFSTEKLDLPYSDRLGDWELLTFDEITYIQSGLYYTTKDGVDNARYRGMDHDEDGMPLGLPLEEVHKRLKWNGNNFLSSTTMRFIGLGLGLRTDAVWRSWERKARSIRLNGKTEHSKRYHLVEECRHCRDLIMPYEQAHPMTIGGYQGQSYARPLPWRDLTPVTAEDISLEEYLEMNDDIRELENDLERWQ